MSGSGEEFNGLINATAALFINGGKLVRYLKKKLKKRSSSNDSARDGLEASLSSGSSAIQSTYSSFLARLGPKFAQGDGKSDQITLVGITLTRPDRQSQ
jgi:hypothetical protein